MISGTWQKSVENCGADKLAQIDSLSKERQVRGILRPGSYWIGIRYEMGSYYWSTDDKPYHGWLSSKVSTKKDHQCAYIQINEFS